MEVDSALHTDFARSQASVGDKVSVGPVNSETDTQKITLLIPAEEKPIEISWCTHVTYFDQREQQWQATVQQRGRIQSEALQHLETITNNWLSACQSIIFSNSDLAGAENTEEESSVKPSSNAEVAETQPRSSKRIRNRKATQPASKAKKRKTGRRSKSNSKSNLPLSERLTEAIEESPWKSSGFLASTFDYLSDRIKTLEDYCIVCDTIMSSKGSTSKPCSTACKKAKSSEKKPAAAPREHRYSGFVGDNTKALVLVTTLRCAQNAPDGYQTKVVPKPRSLHNDKELTKEKIDLLLARMPKIIAPEQPKAPIATHTPAAKVFGGGFLPTMVTSLFKAAPAPAPPATPVAGGSSSSGVPITGFKQTDHEYDYFQDAERMMSLEQLFWLSTFCPCRFTDIPLDLQIKQLHTEGQVLIEMVSRDHQSKFNKERDSGNGSSFAFLKISDEDLYKFFMEGLGNMPDNLEFFTELAQQDIKGSKGGKKKIAQEPQNFYVVCEVIRRGNATQFRCPKQNVVPRILLFQPGVANAGIKTNSLRGTLSTFLKEFLSPLQVRLRNMHKVLLSHRADCDMSQRSTQMEDFKPLTDAKVKAMLKTVPNFNQYKYRNSQRGVEDFILKTHKNGLLLDQGGPMSQHTKHSLRFIFFKLSQDDIAAKDKITYLRTITEAFTSCQAEQARVIDSVFGQLSGRDLSLKEQVLGLLNTYKERILERTVLSLYPSCAHDQRLPHYQSSFRVLFGKTIGLSGVETARHDVHKPHIEDKNLNLFVTRYNRLFDPAEFIDDLMGDINQPDSEAERFIDLKTLANWAAPESGSDYNADGFYSHDIFYDEDREDEYEAPPASDREYLPYLNKKIALDVLEAIFA